MEYQIKMLVLPDGRCPFEVWFTGLNDVKASARIDARITRLESGNLGDSKGVGDGVCEMRIDYGPGYRVYFAEHRRTIIVLLCGGDKSTQQRDIDRAKKMWKDNKDDAERIQRDFRP
jgi:putative addiction module killer protein